MFEDREASAGVRAAIAALLAEPPRLTTASDTELLADVEAVEALGRLVDARRIGNAAQVEHRSRKPLGEDGLAFRMGRRDAPDLIRVIARVSAREARRRVGLGSALASKTSLTGEPLPGRYPSVAAAVNAGEVGLESARIIIEALQSVRKRATPDDLDRAETGMTESACETDPESMRIHAETWVARIDPDGAEPSSEEQHRQRSFTLGRTDSFGMTRFCGVMPVEHAATVKAALNARRMAGPMFKTDAGGDDTDDLESQWIESEGERRKRPQVDYDTVAALFTAGLRAGRDGSGGSLTTPHEVIVQISATDAAARRGSGWAEGVGARLSIPVIEQIACSGGVKLLITDGGEPLYLGKPVRLFTAVQKQALAARFGGCAWPGCTAPVSWCDAHHIRWWKRDDGPTDIDNGILLCSHHHHVIHAKNPAWRIVIHEREPHLVPMMWRGAPEPRHQMQKHPTRLLPPPHDDPWTTPLAS